MAFKEDFISALNVCGLSLSQVRSQVGTTCDPAYKVLAALVLSRKTPGKGNGSYRALKSLGICGTRVANWKRRMDPIYQAHILASPIGRAFTEECNGAEPIDFTEEAICRAHFQALKAATHAKGAVPAGYRRGAGFAYVS